MRPDTGQAVVTTKPWTPRRVPLVMARGSMLLTKPTTTMRLEATPNADLMRNPSAHTCDSNMTKRCHLS